MNDEKLFAFIDGELDEAEAARVEAAINADPVLAARLEQNLALGSSLRSAFDVVLADGVAPPTIAAPDPVSGVVDLAAARAAKTAATSTRPAWQSWGSLAAALVVGVGLGWASRLGVSEPVPTQSPVVVEQGQLIASADLARQLDAKLASDAAGTAETRVILTFVDATGAVCRSFAGAEGSGVACRNGEAWAVRGLFPSGTTAGTEFQQASAGDPRVLDLVDNLIVGEAFTEEQERAARAKGWRAP